MIEVGAGLRVLPLGGCGEVGLNATLILVGDDALLIDCGVLLGLDDAPGVDSAVPDFGPLFVPGRRLHGVVLTHGHEDHIGGVPRLLEVWDGPVHGPPFAIKLLESRLEGAGRRDRLHALPIGGKLRLGPFELESVRVTHSIPDSTALIVDTPAGRLFHSGDFKLDPEPVDGHVTDVARLKALGEAGVDLMLSDSTNAERSGHTRSESRVRVELDRVIGGAGGRVIVACFASHLHRVQSIVQSAARHGRQVALLGRALQTTWELGLREGYLDVDPAIRVDERRMDALAPERLLVLATGTQGEPRAALARLASDRQRGMYVEPGDTVVLSSMTIPGNEKPVRRIVNGLTRRGARVVLDAGHGVHCSGHAHADEQLELLRWIRPKAFVPVHGERTMLEAHARHAISVGVPPDRIRVVEDGESAVWTGASLVRGPKEPVTPLYLDGGSRAPILREQVLERRQVGYDGLVVVSAVVERGRGRVLGRPEVSLIGVATDPRRGPEIAAEVENALRVVAGREDLDRRGVIRSAVRRALGRHLDVRPVIQAHLIEIAGDS